MTYQSDATSSEVLAPATAASQQHWRWVIAIVMLTVVVTGFFDRISVAVLFTNPAFNADMKTGFKPEVLGFLMTAFLLAYAVSALFLSFVGDLVGPRRALGTAAGLWGVFMFLMGGCGSYLQMVLLRIVLGVSEGPQFSLICNIVRRWFPPSEQGRANAIWMIGSPLGSAIGFPLTIWLVTQYGWRSSFYVLGALNFVLVMPLIFAVVRDKPLASATEQPVARFQRSDVGELLRNGKVWLLSAYGAGLLTYLWGLNSWLPTYLQRVRHFDVHQMGFYSSLPFVLMFFAEMTSGYLSDRLQRRAIFSIAGLTSAGVLLFLATRVSDPHMAAVLIALSAGAWGFGLPTHYGLAYQVLPRSATSTGIGIINGLGNLVGACAPAAIGFVVQRTGDFQSGLLVVVLAAFAGAAALLPLVRSH